LNKNDKRKQKPIEEKESNRWLEGYRKLCDLSEQLPGTMLVSISDREGDIYECFVEAACGEGGRRAEYIIRGCQDRSLPEKLEDGCYKKLMEEVSEKSVLGEVEFKLPKHVLMKMGSREPSLQNCDPVGAGWPCSTQASVSQR